MPVCFHLQPADGLAAAVQTAAEGMEGIDADGRPQLVVQIDVIGQPEPLAGVAEAVFIDLRLQGSQLTDIGNLIGSSFRAAARPYRRPHGIERQALVLLHRNRFTGIIAVILRFRMGVRAPAEECAVLVLEAQLRIGLNGEASGIAFDPLLLRYSRSFAAVRIIDKGDHALHAGFEAAVPARDVHGVVGRVLLVDPLDICASVLIQLVNQQCSLAHGVGLVCLVVLDFGLGGIIDIRHLLYLLCAVQLADIVAVGHRAVTDAVGSAFRAGHVAQVVAVGHVALARNAARHIFILIGCTSDTPVVIAVCCFSASDNTAGIYVFLGRSRSVYTAGIPAEICCTADLSGDTTNVTILAINVLYGYRSFI